MKTGLLVLIAAVAASSAWALDLTPKYAAALSEGFGLERPYFTDGGKQYGYAAGSDTRLSGDATSLRCEFSSLDRALMTLSISPLKAETPFADKGLEAYRAAVRARIPGEAVNIQFGPETPSPFPINDWTSVGFEVTYQLGATEVRRNIVFINFTAADQLVVDCLAAPGSYENALFRTRKVVNSIFEMQPGPEVNGSTQS